jgi:glucose-1-phosphatase
MSMSADLANAEAGMRGLLDTAEKMLLPGTTPPGAARDRLARAVSAARAALSDGDVVLTGHLARLSEAGAEVHEAMKLEDPAVKAEEARAASAKAATDKAEVDRVNKRLEEDKATRAKTTAARAAEDKAAAPKAAESPAKPGFLDSLFGKK